VLITIDSLRADHVGAYGYQRAHTPTLDQLAASGGILFEHAFAAAPITLTSHATLLTGRYPPGHGARDNGIRMSDTVPTLATALRHRGFKTAAFVAAFPLDHQFGLNRGFDVYSDRLGRTPDGRPANERPAAVVVSEAMSWLGSLGSIASPALPPFFLWVHVFEPHAPYGDDTARPVLDRYDDEIATADRQIGRLMTTLAPRRADTIVVAAGDHGEAFGEHGEYAHSIFVYDTTLRVPLVMHVPGLSAPRNDRPRVISEPVTLADVAPTVMRMLDVELKDADGSDLSAVISGGGLAARELYAESFAPLVEFGWAPLRAIRSEEWKYIAAPTAELYNVSSDPSEQTNLADSTSAVVRRLDNRVTRYSGADVSGDRPIDAAAAARLGALGYSAGRRSDSGSRPDPKDRRDLAARIAQVTSGELMGAALLSALEAIVRDDPRNGPAHLRLGQARAQSGQCARAVPEFQAALATGLVATDAYVGLATCLGQANDLDGAERVLTEARRIEPNNATIRANFGILYAVRGDTNRAVRELSDALRADPDLHEARFNLALVYARAGRRAEAAAAARELLSRLPPAAPQRAEVNRLLQALQ
jgi:arylsulfatase A-like enzyme/Flp pilus assembly protein TadD